jgi:lipoprotein-anchoring transpeptidase ErfK/SrfK
MKNSPANPSAQKKRNLILPALLVITGCAVLLFAAWSAITSPALASILNSTGTPQEKERSQPFAQVSIAKPSMSNQAEPVSTASAPVAVEIPPTQPAPIEILPTAEVYIPPVETPTAAESTSAEISTPGAVYAEVIPDTPTPEGAPTAVAPYVPVKGNGERWIDVDLSQQRLYAYEGDAVVNSFIVSTGTWQTPTVTGEYKVWVKLRSAAMSGPGYYLPNVPFIMYFYGSYGIHGTYWHNNFGTPMSHGCVNLSIPDAEWLYNFASVGTVVNVHY